MFSKLTSLLPILLLSTTTALPLQSRQSTPSATMVTYFVAQSCDSPYNQAYQSLSNGTCMDLGEGSTTRSFAMQDLSMPSNSTGMNCVVRVWKDETCGGTDTYWSELKLSGSNTTCSTSNTKGDMGSAMMVCH